MKRSWAEKKGKEDEGECTDRASVVDESRRRRFCAVC